MNSCRGAARIRAATILVVAGMLALPAVTPAADPPRPMPRQWVAALAAPDGMATIREGVSQWRAERGLGDLVPVSNAILARLQEPDELPSGDPGNLRAVRAAAWIAPGDPRPQGRLVQLAVDRRLGLGGGVQAALGYLGTYLADPWVQGMLPRRAAAILTLACWVAAAALLVLGLVAYGAPLFHDYADSFPRRFRFLTPWAFALLVAVALVSAGIGPAIWLLLVAVVVAPYFPRRAQVVLTAALVGGTLLPTAIGWLAESGDPGVERAWGLYRVWKGDQGDDLAATLRAAGPAEASEVAFALSRLERRHGNLQAALAALDTRPASRVERGRFYLERGNLLFLQGRGEAALAEYQRAAEAWPEDPLPWLNQHVVHLSLLDLGAADQALARARALGGETSALTEREGAGDAARLLPAAPGFPRAAVRSGLLWPGGADADWNQRLARGLFVQAGAVRPEYFGLLAAVLVVALGTLRAGRRSHRCPACGFLVCPRCTRRIRNSRLCPACWSADNEQELDTTEMQRQGDKTRRWNDQVRRWRRLGTLLLPGWWGFAYGRPLWGLTVGTVWAASAAAVLLAWAYPAPVAPWGVPSRPWWALTLLALTYAVALRQTARVPRFVQR